jgi:hypothetical protein
MKQEDIIAMAREADIDWHRHWNYDESNRLKAFAALVAAAEREECAKVCDAKYAEYPEIDPDYAFALAASDLAKTIRARGQA